MAKADRLDLYATHKAEYVSPRNPVLLTVKPAAYLAIEGRGDPGGPAFQAAVGALSAVAFTVKMARKLAGRDYAVCKLEGRWWASGPSAGFLHEPRSRWRWQLLIRVPSFVPKREVADARVELRAKGKPADVSAVELVVLDEGRVVQALHAGPYDTELGTIERMLACARDHGLEPAGKHHEIYLSDPRRVAPLKLRTILRLPVAAGSARSTSARR
jgi:hypothetical protein